MSNNYVITLLPTYNYIITFYVVCAFIVHFSLWYFIGLRCGVTLSVESGSSITSSHILFGYRTWWWSHPEEKQHIIWIQNMMVITTRRKITYYLGTQHDGDHSQKKNNILFGDRTWWWSQPAEKQHIIWVHNMMVITSSRKTTYYLGTEHDGDHSQKKNNILFEYRTWCWSQPEEKQHIIWVQNMMVITARRKITYYLGTEYDGDHSQKKNNILFGYRTWWWSHPEEKQHIIWGQNMMVITARKKTIY